MSSVSYNNDMGEEEKENLLGAIEMSIVSPKRDQSFLIFFLIISVSLNVFLIILGLFFSVTYKPELAAKVSYESGFTSDLGPIKSEIELVVKPFSGGIELNGEGNFVADQNGHEYVGRPSPAVDQAWGKLMDGLNLDLNKNEVDLANSTFQWPESGLYFSGLDVYHSLHCLNRLRQALYPDYYKKVFNNPTDPSRVHHIGHCINQIRQALQCHADLTPMEWLLDGSKIILKTDTPHTCRNFDRIHAWATSHSTRFDTIESVVNGSLTIVD
ncbi:hypothetical protein F5884DRAFT_869229 [Xylogone sp. PMI_703]|nr:hypothetical protein F5884DRAFT_869229 [Xylogone sp. PMI_703]